MFIVSHDISMGMTSDFTDLSNVEALNPSDVTHDKLRNNPWQPSCYIHLTMG